MRCTTCDKEIENDSIYCRFCGVKVENTTINDVVEAWVSCSNCGHGNHYGSIFCAECGAKLHYGEVHKIFTIGEVVLEMIKVEGGTFMMGATPEQGEYVNADEKPVHAVTLGSFYIGKYLVTQALWNEIMDFNPSHFSGEDLPVEQVNWYSCQQFVQKLSEKTGKVFRLPTEAEWEFAARGGVKSEGFKYSGSNNINEVAWHDEDWDRGSTHPVGTKAPNELGIYDMSGNVREWCQDWYANAYSDAAPLNMESNPNVKVNKVIRGGGWLSYAGNCRVSNRNYSNPQTGYSNIGFRVVMEP
ncbi:MAG: SUMF1/EgtB/PvdO family nonheme iron enzyme [Bacteroidales bacterium]|nr:SUMF1/EgtB/PvdO family nonheme iron enzyme [Bacteroidales bacterium]